MRSEPGPCRTKVVAESVMDTAASLTHQSAGAPGPSAPSAG